MSKNLTDNQRLEKIAEILVRGIYLYARDRGLIEQDEKKEEKPNTMKNVVAPPIKPSIVKNTSKNP